MFSRFALQSVSVFLFLFLMSCASEEHKLPPAQENGGPNLTRFESEIRAQQLSDINYQISLDLTQADGFTGTVGVDFVWTEKNNSDLRMDFSEGVVQTVRLNGKEIKARITKQYLSLPADQMKSGLNHLLVNFTHKFADDGMGLTRFVDPKDNRVYIHSQFEPYYANRMFPCFDQPDLKATYALNVKVPSTWVVTSAKIEKSKVTTNDGFAIWNFPKSQVFSTYLFSLHAGEYKVWQGPTSFKIPLRLLARQSLAEYVDPQEWFKLTMGGFNFYNAYFDFPYPFEKYDQVIAPEFNAGAMENVGNVAFSEGYIIRGKKTRAEKRWLAGTLLHEMAHMWFGDLVTMKWWNDLWLNETFATFMSQIAMSETTEFKESWMTFSSQKAGAMLLDQLVTTHPIESEVKDVQHALTAFDGITYGKGAAVMQQFSFHMGADNFKKGVQNYFKKFAWKNAERADFIASLDAASPEGLAWKIKDWQGPWLQEANINTLRTDFQCKDGGISKFTITETAPAAYPTLRPHSFLIALLKDSGNRLAVSETIKAQIVNMNNKLTEIAPKGTESVYDLSASVTGRPCPDAIYPNYEDHGYFGIQLDPASLAIFKHNITTLKDDFLRKQLWTTFWKMVQNGSMSFVDYGKVATEALATEKNETISDSLLSTLYAPYQANSVYSYYFAGGLSDSPQFHEFAKELEKVIKARFLAAPADQKKNWFNSLVAASDSTDQLKEIKAVLKSKSSIYHGLAVDQDMRWSIVRHLSVWGDPEAQGLIESEYKKDPSFNGKLSMIAAKASLPDWKEKDYWVKAFKAQKPEFTYSEFRRALVNLFPLKQSQFRSQFGSRFFKDLVDLQGIKGSEEQDLFTSLAPFSCEAQSSNSIDDFLKTHQTLYPEVSKSLAESSDLNRRCQKSLQFSIAK